MIQDQRKYYGVAFYSPAVKSLKDINALIPQRHHSEEKDLSKSDGKLRVWRLIYYSKHRFSTAQELDNCVQTFDDGDYFCYTLYLMGLLTAEGHLGIVAAPFGQLMRHIFDKIQRNVKGRVITYSQIELLNLIKAVEKKRHLGGRIKLTDVGILIKADDNIRLLTLRGPNLVHSKTYVNFKESAARNPGISYEHRRCRIRYDDHEGHGISFYMDQFGNFSFHVAKDGRNLTWSEGLLLYLLNEDLMKQTLVFPPGRYSTDKWEDTDE